MRRFSFVNIQVWLIGAAISISLTLNAQSVDSLKRELAKEPAEETKIELLKALGDAQLQNKPQEALLHFEELSRIAQRNQNKLLGSYALNKIGNCWFYLNDLKQSTRFYFQALQASEEEPAYYDGTGVSFRNLHNPVKSSKNQSSIILLAFTSEKLSIPSSANLLLTTFQFVGGF